MRSLHEVRQFCLVSQDETVLARVRTDQRMARREGWMDNLAATLMGSRPMRKRSTTMTVSKITIDQPTSKFSRPFLIHFMDFMKYSLARPSFPEAIIVHGSNCQFFATLIRTEFLSFLFLVSCSRVMYLERAHIETLFVSW